MPRERVIPVQPPGLNGPGRYDAEATAAREACGAKGVVLIVFDGKRGKGFEVQLPPEELIALPEILRSVIVGIEAQLVQAGLRKPSA